MKAKITKDAEKLWSCENFQKVTDKKNKGKLPLSAGEELTLYVPGETPSPFCSAKRAWKVAKPPKSLKYSTGCKVCEHQIDLAEERP
jgi:hypothetical protein